MLARLETQSYLRYLQQYDCRDHRNDEYYHCHDQPSKPVFLVSRMLSCLKLLISCGSLCVPSDLLLLSGFPAFRHVLPLFYMGCGVLHMEGSLQTPPYARPAYVIAGSEDFTRNRYENIAPCGRAFKHQLVYQGPARCAVARYRPRLILFPFIVRHSVSRMPNTPQPYRTPAE